jgi:hypothetical protein
MSLRPLRRAAAGRAAVVFRRFYRNPVLDPRDNPLGISQPSFST